ncbi:pectate lyase domain-containing protein [Ditylenchus destructor]|nr:pectate lyase domain-containing protein [Ditylenchus destructor]
MTYLSIFIILLCHAGLVFADCEYQSWPTPTETVKVVNPQRVKAGPAFDGKMKRYVATTGTLKIEGELAMFELEDGATIQNVVLGKPVADGIHCLGSCTIKNCWWEEAGDDAATFMGNAGATYKVVGGGAKNVPNKVFQHDGGGTAIIENFQVENVGKTWRSCGDCPNNSAKLPRKAVINCIKVTTPGLSIAGVNENYGDSATLNNILIAGNVHDLFSVCQTYEGNTIEKPPPVKESFRPTQDGDGKYCIYKKSDITTS